MVGDVEGLCCRSAISTAFISALGCKPVHLCPLDKLLSSSPSIIPLSSPGIECRCLQGTPIGEGEGPGPGKWAAVDGIEVERSLLFTLTPRQESHPWDSWGHSTTQGSDSCHGDLFWAILDGTGMARGHHIGLEQSPFEVYMMVTQGLVYSSQDLLCNILATFEVMVSVRQNLRLHNRHDPFCWQMLA